MKKVIFAAFLSYFLIVSCQVQARTIYTAEYVKIFENLNSDKKTALQSIKKSG